MDTELAKFAFTVKEDATGKHPFIALEPLYEGLPSLGRCLLTLKLPDGTSIEKTEQIARYIEENVEAVGYTKL